MKKTYIIPSTITDEIPAENLLAGTMDGAGGNGPGGYGGPGTGGGRVKHYNDFDPSDLPQPDESLWGQLW